MSEGRARGRGGRGRRPEESQVQPPGLQSVQQVQQQPAPQSAPVARGRGRAPVRPVVPQNATQPMPLQRSAAESVPEPPLMSGGRGVQRGGGRERQAGLAEGMAQMDINRDRREPYLKYTEKNYLQLDTPVSLGETGYAVELLSNFFNVDLVTNLEIHQYSVAFMPPVESARVKFGLISSLSAVVGPVKVFDGGILYLQQKLEKNPIECVTTRSSDGANITVKFTHVNQVYSNTPQFLQIVNLLFKRVQIALDMKLIRDNYFNINMATKITQHRIEVMPGYNSSILRYEGGNLLCVDIIHKVLRIDTVLDILYQMHTNGRFSNEQAFRGAAQKELINAIVMTKHNNRTYKVSDIAWDARVTDTFDKNNMQVSYRSYYKEHWNIAIRDMDQPLLVSLPTERDLRRGDEKKLFLVPELCVVTGLSDQMRTDFSVMRDLATHTRIAPAERLKNLQAFLQQINRTQKALDVIKPWSVSISSDPCIIPGRQLPPENLVMKDARGNLTMISYDIAQADWSRNMRNVHLLNPVHMNNWIIMYPRMSSGPALELTDALIRVSKGMNMNIVKPVSCELTDDKTQTYLDAIQSTLRPSVQMVVLIVSNNRKDRYDALKKCTCVDNPVPSQVVVARTLQKKQGLLSVATKIAIQLNCKMGGEVWGAEIPLKGLMVLGIDTYHDSQRSALSVGALVASLNKDCTRYFSKTEYHAAREDKMTSLHVLMSSALKKYHDVNQALPSRIILYRDGVGDGQLEMVYETEKPQIMGAIRDAGGEAYNPGFAFIIVKKRIMARLMTRNKSNPNPGTIVDKVITKPSWYDFFLVSQSVRQGTVTPTSYNVIYDSTGLKPDHVQRLTYKMTHLYFNWQGTIRVPAPCQYAHKLAFLQGQSLHHEASGFLADKLFFL